MSQQAQEAITDPMERAVAQALSKAGIGFATNNACGLDFAINGTPVFIEVKQFHSKRIADQMGRVDNVIAIQGRQAVSWFASRLTAPVSPDSDLLKEAVGLLRGVRLDFITDETDERIVNFLSKVEGRG